MNKKRKDQSEKKETIQKIERQINEKKERKKKKKLLYQVLPVASLRTSWYACARAGSEQLAMRFRFEKTKTYDVFG